MFSSTNLIISIISQISSALTLLSLLSALLTLPMIVFIGIVPSGKKKFSLCPVFFEIYFIVIHGSCSLRQNQIPHYLDNHPSRKKTALFAASHSPPVRQAWQEGSSLNIRILNIEAKRQLI
jgi:hypothetical protein